MNKFFRIIYTILLYIIQPIIWLYLLIRSRKIPAYRSRWTERYGFHKKKYPPKGILLHSVSVGEILAAIPLIRTLRCHYPLLPITITTMTPTGSERALSLLKDDIYHVYLPYDLPCAMTRFFNIIRPNLVIIMETELWPNMISILYKRKVPLAIINARLSERSARAYSKLGNFMNHLFTKITLIAAQSNEDGERFISLGLKHNQLAIIGNLKFDISISSKSIAHAMQLRHQLAAYRQVWIATSTHDGEEEIILQAHRELLDIFPDLLLILVPRHPERFGKVCKITQKAGFNFVLRSTGKVPSNNTQIIIGDTMGELTLMYGIADLAFVGGSLIKHGGHNPLEPAAYAIPILMGPYTFNFKEICTKLKQSNGLITVNSKKSIVKEVSILLTNEDYRLLCGYCAIKVLRQNQGTISRLLKLLQPYLP